MSLTNNNNNNTPESSDKYNKLIGKVASWAVAVVICVAGVMYTDAKQRITTLEDRVSFLYQDKVSRAEFREEMGQVRLQIEATKSDILARQETSKADILARIDLLGTILKDRK